MPVMNKCGRCESTINRRSSVFCSGPCKKPYHSACVDIPSEIIPYLTSIPGLSWRCNTCEALDSTLNNKILEDMLSNKCSDLFNELVAKFESMKTDFMKAILGKVSELAPPYTASSPGSTLTNTYAEKVRQNPQQKIIVKPKNPEQINARTKSDILNAVNPIESNIKFNNIKHVKNGGILLGCDNPEQAIKLKELAVEKLSSNYDVHELKCTQPQVRIVGISEHLEEDTLLQYILKQNEDIFNENSECIIKRFWPTKKNNKIFQATLQVDMITYKKVIKNGHLLIGLDACAVYDAIYVPRCFKCNNYFHTKTSCKNNVSCPVCSKNHNLSNCPQDSQYQCINCCNIKQIQKLDINTAHAAWDYENCSAYKKALGKIKLDLFGI